MKSNNADMQDIFCKLSDRNKDIIILIAKGMKLAQEEQEQVCKKEKQEVKF